MKLKAAQRRALPAKDFAGPGRSFPVEDKSHARAALREIGHAPAGAQAKIRAKAEAKLKVPRGEHHQANHREPRTHEEFHRLGNPEGGSAQGTSSDIANRSTATGIATN